MFQQLGPGKLDIEASTGKFEWLISLLFFFFTNIVYIRQLCRLSRLHSTLEYYNTNGRLSAPNQPDR